MINKLGKDGFTKVLENVKSAKLFPERISLYERKELGGTPKDYLLGVDGRLPKGLRAKLGLQPYAEGHCQGGIVHASLWASGKCILLGASWKFILNWARF